MEESIQFQGHIATWEEIKEGVLLSVTVITEGKHQGISGPKITYPGDVLRNSSRTMLGEPVYRFHRNIDGSTIGYHKGIKNSIKGFDAKLIIYRPDAVEEVKQGYYDSVSMEADVWARMESDDEYIAEDITFTGTALLSSKEGTRGADPNATIHYTAPVALETENMTEDKHKWAEETKQLKEERDAMKAELEALKGDHTKLQENAEALKALVEAQFKAENDAKTKLIKDTFTDFDSDKFFDGIENQSAKSRILDYMVSLAGRFKEKEETDVSLSDATSKDGDPEPEPADDLTKWCLAKNIDLESIRKAMKNG